MTSDSTHLGLRPARPRRQRDLRAILGGLGPELDHVSRAERQRGPVARRVAAVEADREVADARDAQAGECRWVRRRRRC